MKHQSSPRRWKEAGAWLRQLRQTAGLTQLELAELLGIKYYAFISQVETGFCRLPTSKLEAWAHALQVDPSAFTKRLLSLYEPELHRLLYIESQGREPWKKRARSAARSAS
ncbi:helix-turn-helix domain-containing protein [Bradyrhizobium sp.]|uniref:helix-turn-helix domain-containing protein n=1 Tax=Bradyrhizobium sp. TaxID=376 RepID=UPI004037B194